MAIPFYHKLVFLLLVFLVTNGLWGVACRSASVQRCIHKLPLCLPLVLQWYTIIFLAFGGFMAWCVGDIVIFDFQATDFFDSTKIEDLWDEKGIAPERRAELAMPEWLRWLSVASPIVGSVAFVVLVAHAVWNIALGAKLRSESGDELAKACPWKSSERQEMVLLVIVMPAVFIIMAVRSTQRMWMVMRGWHTGDEAITDEALFHENLELAAVCQYYTVFVFSQICISFLEEQKGSDDMKRAIRFVGFQGVHAWCLVGSVHSVLLFTLAFVGHHIDTSDSTQTQILAKLSAAEKTVSTIASVLSLLCTYNMLVVCKLPYMKQALGNASMKFNGTKVLLLLGPNQLKILLSLSTAAVGAASADSAKDKLVGFLDLSKERAMLLHTSLLSFECLLVVVLNLVSWRSDGAKCSSQQAVADGDYAKLDGGPKADVEVVWARLSTCEDDKD